MEPATGPAKSGAGAVKACDRGLAAHDPVNEVPARAVIDDHAAAAMMPRVGGLSPEASVAVTV